MFFGKKKIPGKDLKIHFDAATTETAQKALFDLSKIYGQHPAEEADVIVPLGGDGTMLQAMHKFQTLGKPFYGMNLGTVGFLLNPYDRKKLYDRIAAAKSVDLHALRLAARTTDGQDVQAVAFNEVALVRASRHAAKIRIIVNGKEPMDEPLVGDGVMVSTPGGSTAYNLSAGGPIIPIGSNLLALTSISAFRPRGWRGALLPTDAVVRFEIADAGKAPVRAEHDGKGVENVSWVEVRQSKGTFVTLMFDPDHNLEDRIVKEQFSP